MDIERIEQKLLVEFRALREHGFGTLTVQVQAGAVVSMHTTETQDPKELKRLQAPEGPLDSIREQY